MLDPEQQKDLVPQIMSRSALFQLIAEPQEARREAKPLLRKRGSWNPYRQRTTIFRQIIDTLNENEG